jgi:hypothetical protein
MQPRSHSFLASLKCTWSAKKEYASYATTKHPSAAAPIKRNFTTRRILLPVDGS